MDLEKHEVLKAAIKSLCQVFGSIDEESNLPAADLESRLFDIVIGATREDMFARWRTLSLASLLWVKGHYTTVEQGEREDWIQSGVRALQDLRAQFDCDEEAFDMADQFLATLQNTQPDQMIGSVLSDMRVAFLCGWLWHHIRRCSLSHAQLDKPVRPRRKATGVGDRCQLWHVPLPRLRAAKSRFSIAKKEMSLHKVALKANRSDKIEPPGTRCWCIFHPCQATENSNGRRTGPLLPVKAPRRYATPQQKQLRRSVRGFCWTDALRAQGITKRRTGRRLPGRPPFR